ncbi:hypothetical protein CDD82_1535 [Ophiocordyceps australis]|uniref:Dynactin subunit 4 n=1 Tax=Ophiocordyceps australis TaxID=1399860 RepID=A0A2C5ZMW6_9HYPO|nr:hypothetical protein CDD82_1535 [Ophiocordyceps australis]
MAPSTPYTYIQCPCADAAAADEGDDELQSRGPDQDEEATFDPRAPRSNFSLFPLEYLLFCEDCQQIRCPRCVVEEIVTYFCPSCLFEIPSSNLRSEGTRCTRSCFKCPICIAPLQVASLQPQPDAALASPENISGATPGPFILMCSYCNWTSREIQIEFERQNSIFTQLSKINNGGSHKITYKELKDRRKETPDEPPIPDDLLSHDLQFAALKAFYQDQLPDSNPAAGGVPLHDPGIGFSSAAAVTRILSLYTGHASLATRAQKRGPPDVLREATSTLDGLRLEQLDESASIDKLTSEGWPATASRVQRIEQLDPVRFINHLRPVATMLRTKRSKRCPICRHIISKPENKVASTRFKIRLVAKSYIPSITIRPLNPSSLPTSVGNRPASPHQDSLTPLKPYHFILTFQNPLFESIKISLATPSATPGRFSSRVTILCPHFDVDANTDMWDDALRDDTKDNLRKAEEGSGQPEAGKIWDRGRNWVSIVLEVIPASLHPEKQANAAACQDGQSRHDEGPLKHDEDILEIPLFVHIEWEADPAHDASTGPGRDKDSREKRELAYWCVLGVGRISKD